MIDVRGTSSLIRDALQLYADMQAGRAAGPAKPLANDLAAVQVADDGAVTGVDGAPGVSGHGGDAGARIDLDTGTLNLTNVAGEISVNVTGFMDVSNALRALSIRVDGDAPGGGIAGTISFTNVTVAAASGVYGYVEMNGATGRANTGWMKIYVGTEVRYIPYWTQIG